MGQTISKPPQTVLKQARSFKKKKTGQTTGQTILEQAGQIIQTILKVVKPLFKGKLPKQTQDTELLCVRKYFFLNRTIL